MKADPKMNRVGRGKYVCALLECEQPLNELTVKNEDPFCCTEHAREYHGTKILMNPTKRGPTVGSSS